MSPGDQYRLSGTRESNAFVVGDADPEDFAAFLWVIYNPYVLYLLPSTNIDR